MTRALIALLLAALACALAADIDTLWTVTHDPDGVQAFHSVCVYGGGRIFAVGFSCSGDANDTDGLVACLCQNGGIQWTVTQGGDGWEYLEDVCPTPDGGCVAVGRTNTPGNNDAWALCLNADGAEVWNHTWGGLGEDRAESVAALDDGYLVCGSTASYGLGQEDVWLLRLDAAGDTLWTHTYGSQYFDRAVKVLCLPNGNIFVMGGSNIQDAQRNSEIFLLLLNGDGNVLQQSTAWVAGSGSLDFDTGMDACLMPDGTIMVTGITSAESVEWMDTALVHLDAELNILSRECYELIDFYDFGYGVAPSVREGACIISGTTRRESDCRDLGYLMCVDADGSVLWSHTYECPQHTGRYRLAVLPDGDIVQCGWQRTGQGQAAAFVQRLHEDYTAVQENTRPTRSGARIEGVLPNPFNPATRIRFSITRPGPARLDIYDVRGRYIATLLNEPVPPGAHEVQWNGRRADGAVASTGVYCVRLVANGGTDTCKMLLLK